MIKVEISNGKAKSNIQGTPHDIATEFEILCENLLEQGYFNASDLACMLALACSEKSSKRIECSSEEALENLIKKI